MPGLLIHLKNDGRCWKDYMHIR